MPGPDLRRTIEELARDVAGLDYAVAQETLRSVYRLAWLTLLEDIERTLRAGGNPPQQVARLLNSVTRTLRAVDRTAAQWTSQYLPRAYRAGLEQGVMQLAQQNVRVEPPDSSGMLHRGALQSVARDTMQDLLQATKRVEERVKDRVRDVMREDVLSRVATGRRASGKEVAKRLAEEEGVFGVTDKRGRFIPMEEYARMVSHVKLRQAHTEGMEGLMQDHGFDLVQISEHVHKPDLCTPLEGKVYSLTGKTPGWPKLPRHTPFHIGCRHVETPFVDTFLSDARIDELKARSASDEPINVYTPAQLERADAKRAQRERGRKARKERERKNAAAVATRRKRPRKALAEERQVDLMDSVDPPRDGAGGRRPAGRTDLITHGGQIITVVGAIPNTAEMSTVEGAVRRIRPEFLRSLNRIEFLDGPVEKRNALGEVKRGPGGHVQYQGIVQLSRAYPQKWDWSDDDPNMVRRNRNILFHEIGHLVYDDREDLVVEWRAIVGHIPPTVDERELFAHHFQLHFEHVDWTGPKADFFRRMRVEDPGAGTE